MCTSCSFPVRLTLTVRRLRDRIPSRIIMEDNAYLKMAVDDGFSTSTQSPTCFKYTQTNKQGSTLHDACPPRQICKIHNTTLHTFQYIIRHQVDAFGSDVSGASPCLCVAKYVNRLYIVKVKSLSVVLSFFCRKPRVIL